MENLFERKSLDILAELWRGQSFGEAAAECVVPDTRGDVERILTTDIALSLKSKDAQTDRVCLEAELNAAVLYLSEKGIEQVKMTLPVRIDATAPGVDGECRVFARVYVSSYELRAVNPRKLSLTATVCAELRCYKPSELSWFEPASELPPGLMLKRSSIVLCPVGAVTEKTFLIEDEAELDGAETLLGCASSWHSDGFELVGERLIVRGHADIEARFLTDGELRTRRLSLPFSQLFEANGAADCDVSLIPTGEYFDLSDGRLIVELHALVQLEARLHASAVCAADAYSCRTELEISRSQTELSRRSFSTKTVSVEHRHDAGESVGEILLVKPHFGRAEKSGIPLLVEVVFRSEGGIDSRKLRTVAEWNTDAEAVIIEAVEVRVSGIGNELLLRGELKIREMHEEKTELDCICDIGETGPLPATNVGAYLVRPGGDLWETAKKYRSDPELIRTLNEGRTGLLLVPVL